MTIIWLFGRSGSGKTTTGESLKKQIILLGATCQLFDGDELRKTINKDLGFSRADRVKAVEQTIDFVSSANSCDYKIVSMITPFHRSQQAVKDHFGKQVLLTFLDCSIEICSRRDQKGLYIKNPDGLLDFDDPIVHDLSVDSERNSIKQCSKSILQVLLGLEKFG
jgi:adenylylsulfate kinase-like enzyme